MNWIVGFLATIGAFCILGLSGALLGVLIERLNAWRYPLRCAGEVDGLHRGVAPSELAPLVSRMAKGRTKYANGCTLVSLLDEAGEVVHAVNKNEGTERVRDELLDVAAVAMRLYLGEIDLDLELDGLTQKRLTPKSETKIDASR